jgi:hypothetical protein
VTVTTSPVFPKGVCASTVVRGPMVIKHCLGVLLPRPKQLLISPRIRGPASVGEFAAPKTNIPNTATGAARNNASTFDNATPNPNVQVERLAAAQNQPKLLYSNSSTPSNNQPRRRRVPAPTKVRRSARCRATSSKVSATPATLLDAQPRPRQLSLW